MWSKQAEGAQDSTERFGEPCAAQQEQGAQPGTEGRKAEAAQREAPGAQAHRKGGSRRQSERAEAFSKCSCSFLYLFHQLDECLCIARQIVTGAPCRHRFNMKCTVL